MNLGRSFFDSSPSFRSAIQRVDGVLKEEYNMSVVSFLYPDLDISSPSSSSPSLSPLSSLSPSPSPHLSLSSSLSSPVLEDTPHTTRTSHNSHTLRTHISLFAIEAALVCLWRERGVLPQAIVGVGVGEVASAVCAGE